MFLCIRTRRRAPELVRQPASRRSRVICHTAVSVAKQNAYVYDAAQHRVCFDHGCCEAACVPVAGSEEALGHIGQLLAEVRRVLGRCDEPVHVQVVSFCMYVPQHTCLGVMELQVNEVAHLQRAQKKTHR